MAPTSSQSTPAAFSKQSSALLSQAYTLARQVILSNIALSK